MLDVIIDTMKDSVKMLPFLFVAFFIIEYTEHKINKKTKEKMEKTEKYGPIIGSFLGLIPECGFSVIATNLYIARIITLGTLLAIYLTTSDEMLILMIVSKTPINLILEILLIKLIIGIVAGLLIDKIVKKKKIGDYTICEAEHCHCNHQGILISSVSHTFKTFLFILIITFILNISFTYWGENYLTNIFKSNTLFTPLITSLVGLIPSCSASLLITTLLIKDIIPLGTAVAGLLPSAGVGLLVLLKNNEDKKENLKIIFILYIIGSLSGIIINLLNI